MFVCLAIRVSILWSIWFNREKKALRIVPMYTYCTWNNGQTVLFSFFFCGSTGKSIWEMARMIFWPSCEMKIKRMRCYFLPKYSKINNEFVNLTYTILQMNVNSFIVLMLFTGQVLLFEFKYTLEYNKTPAFAQISYTTIFLHAA